MSLLTCVIFFLVLAPLGVFMCVVSLPMAREHAGIWHRLLGGVVCLTGALLTAGGIWFLVMALEPLSP